MDIDIDSIIVGNAVGNAVGSSVGSYVLFPPLLDGLLPAFRDFAFDDLPLFDELLLDFDELRVGMEVGNPVGKGVSPSMDIEFIIVGNAVGSSVGSDVLFADFELALFPDLPRLLLDFAPPPLPAFRDLRPFDILAIDILISLASSAVATASEERRIAPTNARLDNFFVIALPVDGATCAFYDKGMHNYSSCG